MIEILLVGKLSCTIGKNSIWGLRFPEVSPLLVGYLLTFSMQILDKRPWWCTTWFFPPFNPSNCIWTRPYRTVYFAKYYLVLFWKWVSVIHTNTILDFFYHLRYFFQTFNLYQTCFEHQHCLRKTRQKHLQENIRMMILCILMINWWDEYNFNC